MVQFNSYFWLAAANSICQHFVVDKAEWTSFTTKYKLTRSRDLNSKSVNREIHDYSLNDFSNKLFAGSFFPCRNELTPLCKIKSRPMKPMQWVTTFHPHFNSLIMFNQVRWLFDNQIPNCLTTNQNWNHYGI